MFTYKNVPGVQSEKLWSCACDAQRWMTLGAVAVSVLNGAVCELKPLPTPTEREILVRAPKFVNYRNWTSKAMRYLGAPEQLQALVSAALTEVPSEKSAMPYVNQLLAAIQEYFMDGHVADNNGRKVKAQNAIVKGCLDVLHGVTCAHCFKPLGKDVGITVPCAHVYHLRGGCESCYCRPQEMHLPADLPNPSLEQRQLAESLAEVARPTEVPAAGQTDGSSKKSRETDGLSKETASQRDSEKARALPPTFAPNPRTLVDGKWACLLDVDELPRTREEVMKLPFWSLRSTVQRYLTENGKWLNLVSGRRAVFEASKRTYDLTSAGPLPDIEYAEWLLEALEVASVRAQRQAEAEKRAPQIGKFDSAAPFCMFAREEAKKLHQQLQQLIDDVRARCDKMASQTVTVVDTRSSLSSQQGKSRAATSMDSWSLRSSPERSSRAGYSGKSTYQLQTGAA